MNIKMNKHKHKKYIYQNTYPNILKYKYTSIYIYTDVIQHK